MTLSHVLHSALLDELEKIAADTAGELKGVSRFLNRHSHKMDLAGLGLMGIGAGDSTQAAVRASLAKDKAPGATAKRRLLGEGAHAGLDAAGLGLLAAPTIVKMKHHL